MEVYFESLVLFKLYFYIYTITNFEFLFLHNQFVAPMLVLVLLGLF
jgi:hypothetical protein